MRALTLADIPALQVFGRGLSAESTLNFEPHGYSEEHLTHQLTRAELGEDVAVGVFADEDNQLVGYASLWDVHTPTTILCIGLSDEYQGKGLGPQLLDALVAAAGACGCMGVDLTCMPENDRALRLYISRGFVEYGMVKNVFGDGKVGMERGMLLSLREGAARAMEHVAPCLRFKEW